MTDLIADVRRRFEPLLSDARAALQRREEQYPALIEAGKLDAEMAEKEIRTWRAIAQDWRSIVEGEPAGPSMRDGLPDKIEVLSESIRRFDCALGKAIAAAPEAVRRDCTEDQPLWLLESRHGAAVEPVLDIHRQRQRVEELLDWYRAERPFSGQSTIHDHLELNRLAREQGARDRAGRAAA